MVEGHGRRDGHAAMLRVATVPLEAAMPLEATVARDGSGDDQNTAPALRALPVGIPGKNGESGRHLQGRNT